MASALSAYLRSAYARLGFKLCMTILCMTTLGQWERNYQIFARLLPFRILGFECDTGTAELNMGFEKQLPHERDDEAGIALLTEEPVQDQRSSRSRTRPIAHGLLTLLACLLYTATIVAVCEWRNSSFSSAQRESLVVPNLLKDSIRYVPLTYGDTDVMTHPLFGEPTEELEKNWHELLQCVPVTVQFLASLR